MHVTYQTPAHGQRLPNLYTQYTTDFPAVASFFRHNPWDVETFARRAAQVDKAHGAGRAAVAAALREYNAGLGAAPAALSGADALGQPGTLAVVTGQQAGLFTGPLYTVYKAITTIRQARQLTEQLQRTVVPVFWLAGEDHDFEEVRTAHLVDSRGRLRSLQLPGRADGRSIGHRPVPRQVESMMREAAAIIGPHVNHPELLAAVAAAAQTADSVADWFARIISGWLSPFGLVVLDPMQPALRGLAREIYPTILLRRDAIRRELGAAGERLQRRGITPGLDLEPDHAFLFHYHEGRRVALFWADGGLTDREGRFSLSIGQVSQILRERPEDFSPNVVTRPIVQDYLLPTVAQVVGPGELLYLAQLREVYPLFALEMPVLLPRLSLTLIAPEVSAALQRQQLGAEEVWHDPPAAHQRRLAQLDPLGIDDIAADLRRTVAMAHAKAMAQLAPLGPGLARVGQGNVDRILRQVDYLQNKAWQHHRRRQGETVADLQLMTTWLRPSNNLQERVLTALPFVMRYGPDFFRSLLRAPTASGHQFGIIR